MTVCAAAMAVIDNDVAALSCRSTDGSISLEEAQRKNAEHYQRFYGRSKAKDMFF
jgi:hypothetical protein